MVPNIYTENGSKNRSGGFYELRVENKSVVLMGNSELECRCHVHLIDLHISKLPLKAHETDSFYMKPLDIVKPSGPWYSCQPCGVNKLMSMVKSMITSIGISGKSNHSLRASGATEMFKAGVPEKIIQERTGHRSLKALRSYERTTEMQSLSVANVLSAPTNVAFSRSQDRSQDRLGSLGSLIGTASNYVINVNMAGPSVVQTEKKRNS